MPHSFFSLLFRQKYIIRWGLMRSVTPENLASHSMETAVIAHALAIIGNRLYGKHYNSDKAAVYALYHDASEVFTGDMPTPVKYFSHDMRRNYAEIEEMAVGKLISCLPEELRDDYSEILIPNSDSCAAEISLVKAADKLCALIKCTDEIKSGNTEFISAEASIRQAVESIDLDEVKYFVRELLPSFSMTLDEMNGDTRFFEKSR